MNFGKSLEEYQTNVSNNFGNGKTKYKLTVGTFQKEYIFKRITLRLNFWKMLEFWDMVSQKVLLDQKPKPAYCSQLAPDLYKMVWIPWFSISAQRVGLQAVSGDEEAHTVGRCL